MNHTTRRLFLGQAVAFTSIVTLPLESVAMARPRVEDKGRGSLFDQMRWFNDPASARRSGGQLLVVSRPKTDFWRKTFYGYVTDSGHFFYIPVQGDFTFQARVAGHYAALYDQAGLMARVDASNWLKCGIELVDGIGHASVVVTRDFSDWSTIRGVSAQSPLWWKMMRKGDSLEVLYSLDGKAYTSVRLGYLPLPASLNVGVMCAAPEGPGFESTFDDLQLTR
jgi:regulation of enolase protein 1 (concanavalin A-like superfamily)